MEFGAWDAATVLAKSVTYAATFGVAGGVMFLLYSHDLMVQSTRARIQSQLGVFLIVALFATGVRILVLAGSMGGAIAGMLNPSLVRMIVRTGEGPATGMRIAGLLLAGHAVFSARRPGVVAIVGAVSAATSFAWVGHARAVVPSVLPTLLLSIHLICVSFWLGALAPLLLVSGDHDLPRIAATAGRFGRMATFIVGLLIVAGAVLLWLLIGDASESWWGSYGRAFAIKLGWMTILLSVAAFNKLSLTRRLRANDPKAARSLGRSVQFELMLTGLILLTTATLTTLWGPPTLE